MVTHREYVFSWFETWHKNQPPLPTSTALRFALELGPGKNSARELLQQRGYTYHSVDVDPQDNKTVKASMDSLPFESNKYELVFSCHSFEHCERPIDALRECLRVLKPGGRLFMATPNSNTHHILQADFDHVFCLTTEQLLKLITYVGFSNGITTMQTEHNGERIPDENNYNVITTATKPT